MRAWTWLAIGVAFSGPAAAQEIEETREIVVTAPLEGAAFESLQGSAVLTRDDLVAQLNRGLGDTLDALPGVATTFYGAGASRPIIRGLGEDRVRVLENGIGAIDASAASPDHAVTADGLDAERIEVLRGAAALAYGGNAVGGVVNVIDQSIPTRAPARAWSAQALAGASSVDDGWQGEARALAALSPAFALSAGIAARESNDYSIPGSPTDTAGNSWTEYRSYGVGGSALQDWGYAGAAVKRVETEYGLPAEAPGEPGGRIELEQTRYEARGDVDVRIGPFTDVDFAAQYGDYEHTEFEASGEAGTTFRNEGWEARVEGHHGGFGGKLTGAAGVQALDADFSASGEEAFITPTTTTSYGAFVLERWDQGAWGLEGGARLERTQLDNAVSGDRDFTAASASLGAFVRPAQNWFLGATLARTERAPNQFELFADGPHLATQNYEIGDAANGKEIATSLEASLRYATDPLRFEINLYRVAFDDYIALVARGDVFWFDENADLEGFAPDANDPSIPATAETLPVFAFTARDATFTGGEIVLSADLFTLGAFTITGDAAADFVRASFDSGGALPRIPPRTLTLGIGARSDHLDARLEAVDTARQSRVAAFETPTGGYTFVNARLSWRPQGEAGRFSVLVDARNLTDELGRVHASFLKDDFPLPGRSVRVALTARF